MDALAKERTCPALVAANSAKLRGRRLQAPKPPLLAIRLFVSWT